MKTREQKKPTKAEVVAALRQLVDRLGKLTPPAGVLGGELCDMHYDARTFLNRVDA